MCKSCRQPSASTFAALLKLLLIKLSQVIHLPVPRSISKYSINVLFSLVPHFPKLSAPVGLSVSLTHIRCFSSLNNTLQKNNHSSSSSLITEWKKFSFTFSESRYSAFVMAILLECDGAEDWPYFGKAGPDMGKGYYPHILKAIFSNIVYSLQNRPKISSKKDFYLLRYHVKWFPHLVIGSDSNRKLVSTFQTKRLLPPSYYC